MPEYIQVLEVYFLVSDGITQDSFYFKNISWIFSSVIHKIEFSLYSALNTS